MFEKGRDYILDPLLIKRWVDGELKTFNVNPLSYDPETGWVEMTDIDTKEFYNGSFIDRKLEVHSKIKVIKVNSYEEFLYYTRGKK